VSDDFIVKNMKDIEKAANGDVKALNNLRRELSSALMQKYHIDVDTSELDALNDYLDSLEEGEEVHIDTAVEMQPVRDLIEEIARSATTADEAGAEITAALSNL
jgi:hypothetical protein